MGVIRVFRLVSSSIFFIFWAAVVVFGLLGFPGTGASTETFPDPVDGQAVYDPAGALEPDIM